MTCRPRAYPGNGSVGTCRTTGLGNHHRRCTLGLFSQSSGARRGWELPLKRSSAAPAPRRLRLPPRGGPFPQRWAPQHPLSERPQGTPWWKPCRPALPRRPGALQSACESRTGPRGRGARATSWSWASFARVAHPDPLTVAHSKAWVGSPHHPSPTILTSQWLGTGHWGTQDPIPKGPYVLPSLSPSVPPTGGLLGLWWRTALTECREVAAEDELGGHMGLRPFDLLCRRRLTLDLLGPQVFIVKKRIRHVMEVP